MKRKIWMAATAALVVGLSLFVLHWSHNAAAQVAGGGTPVATTVATTNTAILNANTNRHTLWCQNVGATNPIFITFGQAASATNGFLLAGTATTPNIASSSSILKWPSDGCQGPGCVPMGAINAIATGGTSPIVCWED